jgi:predicted NBD/HSP70 family sugar kinase
MAKTNLKEEETSPLPVHGAATLPSVKVDSYNLEIEDQDGFVGDKASKQAFWKLLDKWRKPLGELGQDPLGDKPSEDIGKKKLAELLAAGEGKAAGIVLSAVEEFAQQLALVIRRFTRLKDWRDTECLVIGGGFSASRIGELAMARAELLLRADEIAIDLERIRNPPDEAGLLGAAHLLPAWMLKGADGILAVDVGGTNIRTGIVELNLDKASDMSKAKVLKAEIWRHSDEEGLKRDGAVDRLVEMLGDLVELAQSEKLVLAPMIGIGCPGIIEEDGSIARGAQNLPGNWESSRFNLPKKLVEDMPRIGDHDTLVVMHNDAVVQGLSELPNMQERSRWGVLTIGTGLGNARFTNRKEKKQKAA